MNYFPIYWKLLYPDGRIGECETKSTKSFPVGINNIVMPLSVFGQEFRDGALRCQATIEIELDTLKVNTEIQEDVFTIAKDKAKYCVDADTGLAIE